MSEFLRVTKRLEDTLTEKQIALDAKQEALDDTTHSISSPKAESTSASLGLKIATLRKMQKQARSDAQFWKDKYEKGANLIASASSSQRNEMKRLTAENESLREENDALSIANKQLQRENDALRSKTEMKRVDSQASVASRGSQSSRWDSDSDHDRSSAAILRRFGSPQRYLYRSFLLRLFILHQPSVQASLRDEYSPRSVSRDRSPTVCRTVACTVG